MKEKKHIVNLNEVDVSILEFIQANQSRLDQITIQEMAKANYTSTSTVFRLAKKLGFSGYREMLFNLQ